jgi:hypothetical protein
VTADPQVLTIPRWTTTEKRNPEASSAWVLPSERSCCDRYLIDGTAVARAILDDAARRAASVTAALGREPWLTTVLVVDDPASHIYVKMNANRCRPIGIDSQHHRLDSAASTDDALEDGIHEWHSDPAYYLIKSL